MTAIAAIIDSQNYALLACDGVSTDPKTGAIAGHLSKITMMPEISGGMAIAGLAALPHLVQLHMDRSVNSFDAFADYLPDVLEWIWQDLGKTGRYNRYDSCLALVGWSESQERYTGWRIYTTDRESSGDFAEEPTAAFTMQEIKPASTWLTCSLELEDMRKFGVIGGPDDEPDNDRLIRAICAARQQSGQSATHDFRYNVGGFVQVAQIKRSYAQTGIMHRWPEDVIGEPVDPTRGQPLPDHLMAHYNAQA